jgi:hypothetical protein
MSKLTLSVDDRVILKAKNYAKLHGSSISEIVETFLQEISGPSSPTGGDAPVLKSVRGVLKNADREDYRNHLAAKYR